MALEDKRIFKNTTVALIAAESSDGIVEPYVKDAIAR